MTEISDTQALTDVHDMVVVHRAFRREFSLAPRLVREVAAGDTARAGVLTAHLRLCLGGLHVHHSGEDEYLWPMLLERATPDAEVVDRMAAQHHVVEGVVDRLTPILDRWAAEARPAVTEELAEALEQLRDALFEHLDDEERHLLPIAARHLTQQEWDALGEHGSGQLTLSQLPLLFGMVLEEADADERARMLHALPAPVRLVLRLLGSGRYRRYVSRVRGTARA